jgi:hypothetical protein
MKFCKGLQQQTFGDHMKNLFSINKAADLLERDRATLVRALRHVKPDGRERGQARYRLRTITDALAAQDARNNGSSHSGHSRLRSRLGEIADELEQTHRELNEKRELIKAQPTLDAKQPYSRAAMKVFERLDRLYKEANEIMSKIDPANLLPYVTGPIVGTEFREILAAIWGRDMEIDGMPLFPPGYGE